MPMMRPDLRFIMRFTAARLSLKAAVKLTARTVSHSSSFMRMKRLSRVRPALLTRMSRLPNAASAAGTSFSTCTGSARSQASTCTRSFNSAASVSSAAARVPEMATVAPWRCKARAIAPPMPPVAPVTNAVLPLRSNIWIQLCCGRKPNSRKRFIGVDFDRNGNAGSRCGIDDSPQKSGEDFARAQFNEERDALRGHELHALAPPHRARHLRNKELADLSRIGDRRRGDIGNEGNRRCLDVDGGE